MGVVVRVPRRMLRVFIAPAAALVLVACHGSSTPAVAPTTVSTAAPASGSTVAGGGGSTTVPIQPSGPRTVLSPIGLNIRSTPSKTGAVVGTAAQGVTLTVLSHTDQAGGWYQVKGARTTGYISDNPVLSAAGKFTAYSSSPLNFAALYPEKWTVAEAPPTSVAFRPPSGADSITVSTAATVGQLGRTKAGYHQDSSETVVVCGVTGDLLTLVQTASTAATSPASPSTTAGGGPAERYLILLRLKLDAQHALGVDGNLADLAQVQTIKNFIYSISFPFPQCQQGASPGSDTLTTAPPTTLR